MNALRHGTDTLINRLVLRLESADPITRLNAAGALRLNGRRAIAALPALERLLGDDDSRVRVEARNAIERLKQVAA